MQKFTLVLALALLASGCKSSSSVQSIGPDAIALSPGLNLSPKPKTSTGIGVGSGSGAGAGATGSPGPIAVSTPIGVTTTHPSPAPSISPSPNPSEEVPSCGPYGEPMAQAMITIHHGSPTTVGIGNGNGTGSQTGNVNRSSITSITSPFANGQLEVPFSSIQVNLMADQTVEGLKEPAIAGLHQNGILAKASYIIISGSGALKGSLVQQTRTELLVHAKTSTAFKKFLRFVFRLNYLKAKHLSSEVQIAIVPTACSLHSSSVMILDSTTDRVSIRVDLDQAVDLVFNPVPK